MSEMTSNFAPKSAGERYRCCWITSATIRRDGRVAWRSGVRVAEPMGSRERPAHRNVTGSSIVGLFIDSACL